MFFVDVSNKKRIKRVYLRQSGVNFTFNHWYAPSIASIVCTHGFRVYLSCIKRLTNGEAVRLSWTLSFCLNHKGTKEVHNNRRLNGCLRVYKRHGKAGRQGKGKEQRERQRRRLGRPTSNGGKWQVLFGYQATRQNLNFSRFPLFCLCSVLLCSLKVPASRVEMVRAHRFAECPSQ